MAKFLGVFFALLLASAFAFQQDSGFGEARQAGPPVVPGRYIVVLQAGVDASSVALGHGAIPEQVYDHALNGFAGPLSPPQVAALRADSRVLSIEQDQVVSIADQGTPTGIQRIFADGNANIGIDGADNWRVNVDVAVIDTGIDAGHPDLNVFNSTNCSGGSPTKKSCGSGGADDNGHGTHVAGTIGALDNGIGVVGVAPGARLWSVKVLNSQGSGYMSWIVAGIDYVAANSSSIEVANMSLGCECTSAAMNAAISKAVAGGVVFVVAAGNNDKDAGTFSPANHPDVITVSALADFDGLADGEAASTCRADQDDTLADFSNFGPMVEIAAPGVCIQSTVPGGYATYSGTSMASPHVAGAAALLASMSKPTDKTQALAVRSALIGAGNFDWTDDSPDGIQEPLLDVSNTTVFNPVMVAGSGGGGGGGGEQGTMTASVAGSASGTSRNWTATATTTVLDGDGQPLSGAVVTATWNGGSANSCTTGANGACPLSKTMNKKTSSVTFQVTSVVLDGYSYVGAYPSVTISRP